MALSKRFNISRFSLRRDELLAFQFANISRSLTTLLLAIIVAKSGWNLSTINQWEQLLFIASQLGFSWLTGGNLGINSIWSSLSFTEKLRLPFSVYVIYVLLSLLLSLVGLLLFFSELPFALRLYWAIFLVLYWSGFLLDQLLLLQKDTLTLYLSGFWHFVPYVLSMVPIFFYQVDILTIVKIWIGIALVRQLFLVVYTYQNFTFFLDKSLTLKWIKKSAPLSLYALISSFTLMVCGLIANDLSPDNFAIYRYGSREIPFVGVVLASLSNYISFAMNGSLQEGTQLILKKSKLLLIGLFSFHIVLLLCSQSLFILLFGETLGSSFSLFNIFLLLIIPRTLFPQALLIGKGENTLQLIGSLIESCVIIGFSFLFGKYYGFSGIAFAIVIGFMVEKIIFIYFLWKRHQILPHSYIHLKWWTGLSIFLLSIFYYIYC